MGMSWAASKVAALSAKPGLKTRMGSPTLSTESDEAYLDERYMLYFHLRP